MKNILYVIKIDEIFPYNEKALTLPAIEINKLHNVFDNILENENEGFFLFLIIISISIFYY